MHDQPKEHDMTDTTSDVEEIDYSIDLTYIPADAATVTVRQVWVGATPGIWIEPTVGDNDDLVLKTTLVHFDGEEAKLLLRAIADGLWRTGRFAVADFGIAPGWVRLVEETQP